MPSPLGSVLKQQGADKGNVYAYNPVEGTANERAKHSWYESEAKLLEGA